MTHNKTLLLLAAVMFACPLVFAQPADNKYLTSEDVIELELRHDLQPANSPRWKIPTAALCWSASWLTPRWTAKASWTKIWPSL